ncbi:hypothetical protein SAMD00019534_033140 [Acytostelium subglobosum LB1]|uniref:hypothetical protein n=1 Tax=Acytostelium subglobosum LB1 TaxID=1410327 RepID=UPI0006450795|nr:hypothetical protein SAMD00019534_033140 [Acytostelium subglobosum LB1]GAM20139.1 hypothetical protein SAMD00019534_033140 [Acytostelium subglobosum LB1]|eukprot:XP_012759660.1 hypothetical protein SAMD00019534_033140 [Acytostelium subglobosum LB1]
MSHQQKGSTCDEEFACQALTHLSKDLFASSAFHIVPLQSHTFNSSQVPRYHPKLFVPSHPFQIKDLGSEACPDNDLLPSLPSSSASTPKINSLLDCDDFASDDQAICSSSPSSPLHMTPRTPPVKKQKTSKTSSSKQPPTCHFISCLLCQNGKPSLLEKHPTWAAIMRVVFYTLADSMPEKAFYSLKSDVYSFMQAHWELLGLDKKKSNNWHKQIQDMLSHSKAVFESGSEVLGQYGFWRLRHLTDPFVDSKINVDQMTSNSFDAPPQRQRTSPLIIHTFEDEFNCIDDRHITSKPPANNLSSCNSVSSNQHHPINNHNNFEMTPPTTYPTLPKLKDILAIMDE